MRKPLIQYKTREQNQRRHSFAPMVNTVWENLCCCFDVANATLSIYFSRTIVETFTPLTVLPSLIQWIITTQCCLKTKNKPSLECQATSIF